MAMVGRGSGQLLAAIILILIHQATNAPVTEEGSSQALQVADSTGDGRGCYYNFEHYDEGDRILTNEPCLNCTCHNRMLMCYLRVCPFTKAIGQDCTVEKIPDQCCPIITCPQVPVALLTSSTTSETPPTTTALGRPDNYGCILEDNTFYADGAQVPSDPKKPCELCYCIRNHTACVMQECTLNVEGCKPVYQEGVCCPVRYDCDYDEIPTTPKPVGLVTTPGGFSDCLHNGQIYHDGAMVMKDEKAPCEHCYCMRGDIVCAVQECGTPLEGRDCTPLERTPGQCCPNYHCANGTQGAASLLTSTEKLPEPVKEAVEAEKQDSSESSESDNSSEESQEASEASPPKESDTSDENESLAPQVLQSTEAPEQTNVSDGGNIHEGVPETEVSQGPTEAPQQSETTSVESIKTEENIAPGEQQPDDSHSEASQHEVSETHVPHDSAKDPQITNEIPALPSIVEHPEGTTTTEEPPIEAARIPGEGSCLVEGKTYAHNTIVPTENPCQEVCRCFSSIVSCKPRDCPPAPSPDENCSPVITPGACCPTYMCDQKTSDAPQIQDQKIDNTHHEESSHFQDSHPTTQPPVFGEPPATEAPVIVGIPPDSLTPGINEQGLTPGLLDEGSNLQLTENESHKEEGSHSGPHESVEDNNKLNTNIALGHEVSLHGGQMDNLDSVVNGNAPHPADDISTAAPFIAESTIKNEVVQDITTLHTLSTSNSETESPISNQHEQHLDNIQEHEVINDSQSTESNEFVQLAETTTAQYHEGNPEENAETISETQAQDKVHSSSEAAITEQISTDSPVDDKISSEEKGEQDQNQKVPDQSHFDAPPSEDNSSDNEEHVTHQPDPETEHFETTATPAELQDISHNEEYSQEPHKDISTEKPEEMISTEKSEQPNIESERPHIDGEIVGTTAAPEASETSHFNEESSENKPNLSEENKYEENHKPTDLPLDQQEPLSSSTIQPIAQEEQESGTTEQPTNEEVAITHHDSLPESSQQNVETAENIGLQEQNTEIAEGNKQISTESQNIAVSADESPSISADKSPSITNEAQSTEKPIDENKNEQGEAEKISETSENNLEEKKTDSPAENIEEQKQEGISADEVTSPPEKQTESSGAFQDELPIISQEEIKVTGMPTIESHVTEGNLDHSVSHQEITQNVETTTPGSQEDHEIHIPGPEGIPIEKEPEISNISETEKVDNVEGQTEENPLPNPTNQNEEKVPSQVNTESETNPPTSPEIINEINEEKESLNHITSDNTAQLIDDINQIIQNEVNNQLYHPEGENVHVPTNEQSELKPLENESEQTEQQTTVTPPQESNSGVSLESSSESELQKIPEETTGNFEINATENINIIEKEPPQNQVEEGSSGSNDAAENTDSYTTPPSHESSSASAQEDSSTEKQLEQISEEEKTHSENDGETSLNESSTDTSHIVHHNVNEETQQPGTADEATVSNESIPSSEINAESQNQNNIDTNEISTEQANDKVPEPEQKPSEEQSSITESSPHVSESSYDAEQNAEQSPATEDHNQIPEDVTHVAIHDPQAPDSANQVIEASGDDESIPSTEQAVQEHAGEQSQPSVLQGSGEEVSFQVEKDQETSGDITHQEGNIVPSEENVINDDKNEQISEENQQNIDVEKQHPEQTVDSQTESIPTAHDPEKAPQESGETQGIPSENEETTEHQEMVPEHGTEAAATEGHLVTDTESTGASSQTDSEVVQPVEPVQHETNSESQESATERLETASNHQELLSDHQENHELVAENQESASENQEPLPDHQESSTEYQESLPEHQETSSEPEYPSSEHQDPSSEPQDPSSEHQETISEHQETPSEPDRPHFSTEQPELASEQPELASEQPELASEQPELASEQPELASEQPELASEQPELASEQPELASEQPELASEQPELASEHQETPSEHQETPTEHQETPSEHQETPSEHQETPSEHQETPSEHQETPSEHQETPSENQETPSEHQEPSVEHQEPSVEHQEPSVEHQEPSVEHQEPTVEHQEPSVEQQEPTVEHQEPSVEHQEPSADHQDPSQEIQENVSEHQDLHSENHEHVPEHQEIATDQEVTTVGQVLPSEHEEQPLDHHEPALEQQESTPEQQEPISEHQTPVPETQGAGSENLESESAHQETESEHQETVSEHLESDSGIQDGSSAAANNLEGVKESSTAPSETSSDTPVEHPVTQGPEEHKEPTPEEAHKEPAPEEAQTGESDQDAQKIDVPTTSSPISSSSSDIELTPAETQRPNLSSDLIQSIAHSTESASINDISSSTHKPPVEEPSPMFPTWSQKPFEHHTTPEPHPPEENPYPTGFDPEYEDEEGVSYGPGTCRYGGKVYLSAQQIPRDDPCDFCFCFRSDIICLQQSCPPPIRGCYQETIKGFCCPRYECHVSMATMLNITTTTTTTTTTLPPHFFAHAYNGAATKAGCQVKGVAYHVGEKIPSTSGPCLECRCGANGQMKCDPTVCGPQEALLRQVMDAAVNRRRR